MCKYRPNGTCPWTILDVAAKCWLDGSCGDKKTILEVVDEMEEEPHMVPLFYYEWNSWLLLSGGNCDVSIGRHITDFEPLEAGSMETLRIALIAFSMTTLLGSSLLVFERNRDCICDNGLSVTRRGRCKLNLECVTFVYKISLLMISLIRTLSICYHRAYCSS